MSRRVTCRREACHARAWYVDLVTGDTFCRAHGVDKERTRAFRSPAAVATGGRRT